MYLLFSHVLAITIMLIPARNRDFTSSRKLYVKPVMFRANLKVLPPVEEFDSNCLDDSQELHVLLDACKL